MWLTDTLAFAGALGLAAIVFLLLVGLLGSG